MYFMYLFEAREQSFSTKLVIYIFRNVEIRGNNFPVCMKRRLFKVSCRVCFRIKINIKKKIYLRERGKEKLKVRTCECKFYSLSYEIAFVNKLFVYFNSGLKFFFLANFACVLINVLEYFL